jgi:hypothetical protein
MLGTYFAIAARAARPSLAKPLTDCSFIPRSHFRLIQGSKFDREGKCVYNPGASPARGRFRAMYHGPKARIGSDENLACTAAGETPSCRRARSDLALELFDNF